MAHKVTIGTAGRTAKVDTDEGELIAMPQDWLTSSELRELADKMDQDTAWAESAKARFS